MRWIRSRAKRTSGLALFALAIQFALSFGHFHPLHVLSSQASKLVAVASALDHSLPGQDADHCDICAVVALASVTIAASPPTLPLPDFALSGRLESDIAFGLVETRRFAFQQRAPPTNWT